VLSAQRALTAAPAVCYQPCATAGTNSADDQRPRLQKKGKTAALCLWREAVGPFLTAGGAGLLLWTQAQRPA